MKAVFLLFTITVGLTALAMPGRTEVAYDWPGVRIQTGDFTAHARLRFQWRYAYDRAHQPGAGVAEDDEADLNRARFKLGGQLFHPRLDYYTEYDFPSERLLDLRVTWTDEEERFNVRAGQWKVPFNRERVDSSGQQQFVDRSLANGYFTLDRQRGVALSGRVAAGTSLDNRWTVAVLQGAGRGQGQALPDSPMWLGRLQWNPFGRELPFAQSDVSYREQPAGAIALAGVAFTGPYTAFASGGGTQLPGFVDDGSDRYRVRQAYLESAWQFDGLSWQQELHLKQIDDTATGHTTRLDGGYAQLGWFPHRSFSALPKPFEVAVRWSAVDPDRDIGDDHRSEATLAFNWFFAGHDNKLTLDISRLRDHSPRGVEQGTRIRVQWDFHL
jgi:hypothetical protein